MLYASNGGFNWNDLYNMPTYLREFYWTELISTKEAEKEAYNKAGKKSSISTSKNIARRR